MSQKNLPNIIFIVLDSARRDLFGSYGNQKQLTPFLDALAEDSLVMMDHYAAGCGSAQAHVSMFLGQHSARHKVVHNMSEMKESVVAFPSLLAEKGYKTYGHCMSSFIPPAGYEDQFGFTEFFYPGKVGTTVKRSSKARILDRLKKYPKLWKMMKTTYGAIKGREGVVRTTAKSLDGKASLDYLTKQLRLNKGKSPVFGYTTLLHPHTPYAPPQWCIERVFGDKKVDDVAYAIQQDMHAWVNGDFGNVDDSIQAMKMLYEAEMVYADHLLEQFVTKLKEDDLFDNSILIVTSDHGEMFGEHGQLNHGATIWEEISRLPLFIYSPENIPEGRLYKGVSSGLDLMPTILDLVGAYDTSQSKTTMDGISLLREVELDRNLVVDSPPLVLPERLKKYPNVVAKGNVFYRAVRNNQYKYVWQSNGRRYLYNIGDYEEPDNSIMDANPHIVESMHNTMMQYYEAIDPEFDINTYPINMGVTAAKKMTNPIIVQELKKLGYL